MFRIVGLVLLVSSWQLQALSPSAALRATRAVRGAMSKNVSEYKHLQGLLEQLRTIKTQSRLATRMNAGAASGDGIYVGIDLGTTNSVVSIISEADGAVPEVLFNLKGSRLTPSVVQFDEAGKATTVGADAVSASIQSPANTISSVKRFIGSSYDDAVKEINIDDLPYKIIRGSDGRTSIELSGGKTISPEQVSAEVLANLLESVKKTHPDKKIKGIVVTVPERFISDQRDATLNAARIAGFPTEDSLFLVNEPSAAAMSFGVGKGKVGDKIIVVDLGGGTTDLALLEVIENDFRAIDSFGDTALGGDNIDEAIVAALRTRVEAEAGFKLNAQGMDMLRKQAINAKHSLSSTEQVSLTVNAVGEGGFMPVQTELTRADLEGMIDDFVAKTADMVKELLSRKTARKRSSLTPDEISEVVFVGGTTRIPLYQEKIAALFPNSTMHFGENPDEAVSIGAAIYAKARFTKGSDISLEQINNVPIGIALKGDKFHTVYDKGEAIPGHRFTEGLSAGEDRQSTVAIEVYQGERPIASANKALGRFSARLDDVTAAKRAEDTNFRVDMHLDSNGTLKVEFTDVNTGTKVEHVLDSSTKLSEEEIARMKNERLLNEEGDALFVALTEARDKAQGAIAQARNLLDGAEYQGKASDATRQKVEDAIAAVKSTLEGDNIEDITAKLDTLAEELSNLAKEIDS